MQYQYMGHAKTQSTLVTTGLLSQAEREFLNGDRDVENPDGYHGNLRHRARKRIEQIERDLELLDEHGHDDIVNEFWNKYSEHEQLRDDVDEIRDLLDELSDEE